MFRAAHRRRPGALTPKAIRLDNTETVQGFTASCGMRRGNLLLLIFPSRKIRKPAASMLVEMWWAGTSTPLEPSTDSWRSCERATAARVNNKVLGRTGLQLAFGRGVSGGLRNLWLPDLRHPCLGTKA